ncbi:Uncharacterized protein GBIM_20366 [Gryllus bimaculatus]|nr:Uncharacterized protein GBIM_20366 [Gryllus bimaculatus]
MRPLRPGISLEACHPVYACKLTISLFQRHCRLKHDGNVQIVTAQKYPIDSMGILGKGLSASDAPEHEEEERDNSEGGSALAEPLQCPVCPFACLDPEDLNRHQQKHQPQQGAIFKCYLCPYYVALKTDLHDHLQLHGVSEPEEHLSRALQGTKMAPRDSTSPCKVLNESEMGGNDFGSSLKRYRCAGCPYVSNSKSQFLYHKQFHRPRGAPFKCGLCSYSVSRRHLLHQHLRVHGILIPPQRSPGREAENERPEADGLDDGDEEAAASGALRAEVPDLDTRQLPEVPLVWVSRNGRFDKLYKCRWCPHVNQRKANIMEHEKMHRRDEVDEHSEGEESSPKALPPHRCPLCNYGCHNAGVLSAHMKVHQGAYGTVRALVDLTRSDEAQLEELGAASDSLPPLLLPQTNEDLNQGVEDAQEETVDFRIEPPFASEPPPSLEEEVPTDEAKVLMFCQQCPARFLVMKELNIHKRFHEIKLAHRCESCNYTARQRPHLLAHIKVHSGDYQERSDSLAALYPTSPAHPRPRTAVIVEGPGVSGPVWVVVSDGLSTGPAAPPEFDDAEDLQDTPPPPPRPVIKQFSCTQCPAKFFKSVALEYHKTLHGGTGNYRCKYCDYRVKTYGNLVKHEMIHEHPDSEVLSTSLLAVKPKHSTTVPLSGTDLFQQRAEVQKLTESTGARLSIDLPADPQFGTLMHGNPEFVYPMYFKNGRLKEKRYKCHKCPSAFEKREQYKVHLSLHGSKQRYKCEKCDYSVKYYANFIQHQRKHQHNDEAHAARRAAESTFTAPVEDGEEMSEEDSPKPTPLAPRSTKTIGSGGASKQVLTAAEQQAKMLDQVRERVSVGLRCDEDRKTLFRCAHCPYASARRDGLESHAKRHAAVSGACGAYTCQHCDYSAPQLHFLREHVKLHFDAPRKLRPEAYTRLEKLTIWVQMPGKDSETHTLVFQDKGTNGEGFERFYPPLPVELQICDENSQESRILVDIRTGEPLSEASSRTGVEANNCESADEVASQIETKKKAASCKLEAANVGSGEGVEKNVNRGGNSGVGSTTANDDGCEEGNSGYDVDEGVDQNDDDACDVEDYENSGNDNANRSETVVENDSEEESRMSSKIEKMTRRRTARKSESHADNSIKNRKVCVGNSKDNDDIDGDNDDEHGSESEDSEDGDVDVEGDDSQILENVSDNQKPEVLVPDDGESRLSASSSCDSSSSNSSSGSSSTSSSSSSSSSSGTSSSSSSNGESKSSDSSSECDAEESDKDRTQRDASQEESLSSET